MWRPRKITNILTTFQSFTESSELHNWQSRSPLIALAGVPNAGKTSLFNSLSGLSYKVANYPGVTVEKREARIKLPEIGDARLVDLPGTYSLFGGSPDEQLAVDFLLNASNASERPDLVICVVDACNLDRNLYLASQLIDTGLPVVLAIAKADAAKRRGIVVRTELMANALGVSVINVHHANRNAVEQLKSLISGAVRNEAISATRYRWCKENSYLDFAEKLGNVYAEVFSKKFRDTIAVGIGLLSSARHCGDKEVCKAVAGFRKNLQEIGIDAATYEASWRYEWIEEVVKRSVSFADVKRRTRTEAIDRIVTHRVYGFMIFFTIMAVMFQSIFTWASVPMDLIDHGVSWLQQLALKFIPAGQLQSLVVDGVIAGVGSVVIFVPQIAILYLFISVLEESGYLCRAAYLLDKIMRHVGLQGRSFIPLLSSFACAVPGIMATRSIPSHVDRLLTILVAPLMSCSARLPVYTLLIAAFIPNQTIAGVFSLQGLVFLALYFLGMASAASIAFVAKKFFFRGEPSHFVMEMPPYCIPRLGSVLAQIWEKVRVFAVNAGTVILACSIILWFMASYPRNSAQEPAEVLRHSYAGRIGHAIEPVIRPLGFDWKIGLGLVASFAAREVFVSSMALVNNLEQADEQSESLIAAVREAKDPLTGEPAYAIPTALSLMVFYVFACQCISTLAVSKRETGSWKWPAIMFAYMAILAYVASFVVYQVASVLF